MLLISPEKLVDVEDSFVKGVSGDSANLVQRVTPVEVAEGFFFSLLPEPGQEWGASHLCSSQLG